MEVRSDRNRLDDHGIQLQKGTERCKRPVPEGGQT
jgi:hypothetical protein